MNNRERRDFEAGLAAEVDAWLRGEETRRDFIKKFGMMAGLLAVSGGVLSPWVDRALAQAAVDLADPSTPLGQAQAAAMKASTEGPTDGSAYRAAQAKDQDKMIANSETLTRACAGCHGKWRDRRTADNRCR